MIPYVLLLVYITVCSYFIKPQNNKSNKKRFNITVITAFLILSCFRNYTVGADTIQYYRTFSIIKNNSLSWCIEYLRFEPGFVFLEKIVSTFSNNPQSLLIITSIIIIGTVFFFINKNSENTYASIMLFVLLNIYFMYMSAMRQAIAICIIIIGYTLFFKNDKKIKYTICVLLASLFHSSALIMLLLVFFPKKINYDAKNLIICLTISLLCFIMPNRVFNLVAGFTKYSTYENTKFYQGSEYAGIISYFISIILLIFTYTFSRKKDRDKTVNYFLIIMSLNTIFYALAAKISVFTRITTYFDIFNIIAIPNTINNLKLKSNQKVLYILFSIFLISYWSIISIYRPEWYGCIPYVFYK